jgi:TPR repeat protein
MLDRLMLRASQLREQGDIAAARAVLESGADSGHGPALFQLAETYDPDTLSAWRTLGTRGDVAKARELYLKAEQAGVAEATERLKSLPH